MTVTIAYTDQEDGVFHVSITFTAQHVTMRERESILTNCMYSKAKRMVICINCDHFSNRNTSIFYNYIKGLLSDIERNLHTSKTVQIRYSRATPTKILSMPNVIKGTNTQELHPTYLNIVINNKSLDITNNIIC